MDEFLTKVLGLQRSRVEGCLYIHRKDQNEVKLINYVYDAFYASNNQATKIYFESKLKKKFNLTLMGPEKWYLGIRIKQHQDYTSIVQEY